MPYKDPEKQRAAQQRYYAENKSKVIKTQRDRRSKWRKHIEELKANTPCMDCGIQYPSYMMDFDHRPDTGKIGNISNQLAKFTTFEKLQTEIDKCDIVCSNCHRHRSWMRMGGVA